MFLNEFKKKVIDDLNADQFDPMCNIPDSNRCAVASSTTNTLQSKLGLLMKKLQNKTKY
jgi:hypothetical protein